MILPSDATPAPRPWGPDQDRLHRHLLRHPSLLPKGARLLLAVSGGQDSMALTALLRLRQTCHPTLVHRQYVIGHNAYFYKPPSMNETVTRGRSRSRYHHKTHRNEIDSHTLQRKGFPA